MADDRGGGRKYSCNTASETLEWIHAIIDFLKPYRFFLDAHVVNFFKDRLWEAIDDEWMDCLRKEPVENLLQIPSGLVRDHWPCSLREFVLRVRSLSLPRNQADLQKEFPGLKVAELNNVIAQGMNQKKKHEIETLAAVISSTARKMGANTIVDVGSGQGYLAQVLSFEHELSVIAIDASSHHGSITDARAKRIEKYYASKILKSRSKSGGFSLPKTVTCQVLSPAMLKDVSNSFLQASNIFGENVDQQPLETLIMDESHSFCKADGKFLLAGLHACGDLSVTMLRTFVESDEVKAVISIGCCYNLLSEEDIEADNQCGFPMSNGVKSAKLLLGKNARDLACQSAERWRGLGEADGLHNFELHAFRAAFQMVLSHHYPEIIARNPTIGRQGKALRRRHHQRILECNADPARNMDPLFNKPSQSRKSSQEASNCIDKYSMFVKFCESGLVRLGQHDSLNIDFSGFWREAENFFVDMLSQSKDVVVTLFVLDAFSPRGVSSNEELIGPYWTLRASLGPVLETLLLLDRLLFLQEQGGNLEVVMLPLFDPVLSPRNVALIAEKV